MLKEIYFNKKILIFRYFTLSAIILLSIYVVLNPEVLTNKKYNLPLLNRIMFSFMAIYSFTLLYSNIKIFNREIALRINEQNLFENSSYESLGTINWEDVYQVNIINKRNIEIVINKNIITNSNRNFFIKFLLFMKNWNYKNSIIISTYNLNCEIDEIYNSLIEAIDINKKLHTT